jgi:hypothetical protein
MISWGTCQLDAMISMLMRMWLYDLWRHMPTEHNDLWASENVKVRNSEFPPWNFLWLYLYIIYCTLYIIFYIYTLHITYLKIYIIYYYISHIAHYILYIIYVIIYYIANYTIYIICDKYVSIYISYIICISYILCISLYIYHIYYTL